MTELIPTEARELARALPVEFKMNFKVEYETVIRGHHVYKGVWTPFMNETLECNKDTRAKAKEHDENAIGVYRVTKQLDLQTKTKTLVGHFPIELSRLMKYFLEANTENKLVAQVSGKRKREMGLVVPAKFSTFTIDLRLAKILKTELNKKALKYTTLN